MSLIRFLMLPECIDAFGRNLNLSGGAGQNVAGFLRETVAGHPGALREIFDDQGRPRGEIVLLKNGRPASWDEPVGPQDELDVFQVVEGG